MSTTVIAVVLAVYAILLWVGLFFVWHRGYREWKENRANRVCGVEAKILDKRQKVTPAATPGEEPASEYFLLFESRGRQREHSVEQSVFSDARVGMEGTLYLRGDDFERFDPKSEVRQAEDVYRKMTGR